jgi:hypothetical protein
MKKSLLALLIFASCSKELTPKEQHYITRSIVCQTWKVTELKEVYGKDTVTFNFTDPAIQDKWAFQFWWKDGIDYTFPPVKDIGHGIRYTPIDPRKPSGPRVAQYFDWWMTDDENKFEALIGGNKVEILVKDSYHIVLHQLDPGVERFYKMDAIPNGVNMGGLGPVLPG